MWASVGVSAFLVLLSVSLLIYICKTGKYQFGYIFMIAFPIMFFTSGGYRSGMPAVFMFAVLFTILMLTGKKALFISLLEITEYILVCVYAYYHPEAVTHYETEAERDVTDE